MECPQCGHHLDVFASTCPQCQGQVGEMSLSIQAKLRTGTRRSPAANICIVMLGLYAGSFIAWFLIRMLSSVSPSFLSGIQLVLATFIFDLLVLFSLPAKIVIAIFCGASLISLTGIVTVIYRRKWGAVPMLIGGIGQLIAPLYLTYMLWFTYQAAQHASEPLEAMTGMGLVLPCIIGWGRWILGIVLTMAVITSIATAGQERLKR